MEGDMKIKDIMAIGALTVPKEESVEAAARLMKDQSVGLLLVGTGEHIDGVVTDRDLLVRCVAQGDSPSSTTVGECMSSDVITVDPEADPLDTASVMRIQKIHRMPVAENGKPLGVVSLTDITQAMDEPLHDLLIGSGSVRQASRSTHYNLIGVAALTLIAPLHLNDVIQIVGHNTDLKQPVTSMEIEHTTVESASPGEDVAIKVNGRVRTGDSIYLETVR
jgi:CBS domain-containing protein